MLFLLKVEIKQMPQMPVKDFLGYVIKEWEYFFTFPTAGKDSGRRQTGRQAGGFGYY